MLKLAENLEAWKVYQMWCMLPESVKNCWIEAGKTINTYDELAKSIPNKVNNKIYLYFNSIKYIFITKFDLIYRLLSLIQIILQMAVWMNHHLWL